MGVNISLTELSLLDEDSRELMMDRISELKKAERKRLEEYKNSST